MIRSSFSPLLRNPQRFAASGRTVPPTRKLASSLLIESRIVVPARRWVIGVNRTVGSARTRGNQTLRLSSTITELFSAATKKGTETEAAVATEFTPPLAVRSALVASTTAIATPAFPVVGFVNFGLRFFVIDRQMRQVVFGPVTIFSATLSLLTMAVNDLLPYAYSFAGLFLPFAVVNGALAGAAFTALDTALGTAVVAQNPLAGASMGAFVGLVGPISGLYDSAFQWFYNIPEVDGYFSWFLCNGITLPISVSTGFFVGGVMHPLLYRPILGLPGTPWARFSGIILATSVALFGHLYYGDYINNSRLFPPETYMTSDEAFGLLLRSRFHAKELQALDWGPNQGYQPFGTGAQARESVHAKLEEAKQNGTNMIFTSRRTACK
jgi:hypothetical protein